jgi:hypothetical protein
MPTNKFSPDPSAGEIKHKDLLTEGGVYSHSSRPDDHRPKDVMEVSEKRILQDVLTDHGFSGWYVIDTGSCHHDTRLLFNPKEKRLAEISIPDKWLDDPQRHTTIGESLAMTIRNCTGIFPHVRPSSSRFFGS